MSSRQNRLKLFYRLRSDFILFCLDYWSVPVVLVFGILYAALGSVPFLVYFSFTYLGICVTGSRGAGRRIALYNLLAVYSAFALTMIPKSLQSSHTALESYVTILGVNLGGVLIGYLAYSCLIYSRRLMERGRIAKTSLFEK